MYKILFSIIFVFFLLIPHSYADEVFSSGAKSIKELSHQIEKFNAEQKEVDNRFRELVKSHKIQDYIRQDLLFTEKEEFKNLVITFNQELQLLQKKMSKTMKNGLADEVLRIEIIRAKKKFYENLKKYIKPEKYQSYIGFVSDNQNLYTERSNILFDSVKTKKIIDTKVDILEKKIEEHHNSVQKTIKKVVRKRFSDKFESLKNNPDFEKLEKKTKFEVLQKTTEKHEERIKNLEKKMKTGKMKGFVELYEKKLEIYYLSLQELKEFRDQYK